MLQTFVNSPKAPIPAKESMLCIARGGQHIGELTFLICSWQDLDPRKIRAFLSLGLHHVSEPLPQKLEHIDGKDVPRRKAKQTAASVPP